MARFVCNFLILFAFLSLVLVTVSLNKLVLRKATAITMKVSGAELHVETAKTPLQIEKGLGDRVALKSDGMLFYMPQAGRPMFWMKGMQFALDFIWINDGKVVDLTENVQPPAPNTPDNSLQTYQPKTNVTHVLEVPAGYIKQHKIKIDDTVEIPK